MAQDMEGSSLGSIARPGYTEESGWVVEVVPATGSTNDDLMERVRRGVGQPRTALISLEQKAGKGRLNRAWVAPAGSSLLMSMTLPTPWDQSRFGWMSLATGLAVVQTLTELATRTQKAGAIANARTAAIRLKWPNDVLVNEGKVCGILVEAGAGLAVAGVGINLTQTPQQLPVPGATSLAMEGIEPDRNTLVEVLLARMDALWELLTSQDGGARLSGAYQGVCDTLTRRVRVHLSDHEWVDGVAVGIGEDGSLLVDVAGEVRAFASGDVFHLR